MLVISVFFCANLRLFLCFLCPTLKGYFLVHRIEVFRLFFGFRLGSGSDEGFEGGEDLDVVRGETERPLELENGNQNENINDLNTEDQNNKKVPNRVGFHKT